MDRPFEEGVGQPVLGGGHSGLVGGAVSRCAGWGGLRGGGEHSLQRGYRERLE